MCVWIYISLEGLPIFGVSLDTAVERSRCHDGLDIPLPLRECIDYIQQFGLNYEGIYKNSGTKSKVLHIKKCYNQRRSVDLSEYDVPTITSVLKTFLRYSLNLSKQNIKVFFVGIYLNQYLLVILLLDLKKLVPF